MPENTEAVSLEAEDPTTPQSRLAEIAAEYPSLHEAILRNPACYEDLRGWIADYPKAPAATDVDPAPVANEPAVPADTALATASRVAAAQSISIATRSTSRRVTMSTAVLGALGVVVVAVVGCSIAFAVMINSRPAYADYDVPDLSAQQEETILSPEETGVAGHDYGFGPQDPRIPASCDALYSTAMRAELDASGLILNPDRTIGAGLKGTRDTLLASYIQQPLTCAWVSPAGDTSAWLTTTISALDPSDSAAVESQLAAYTGPGSSQFGGVRYLIDEVTWGESHLLREGLWFATSWSTVGPNGYTADIVAHVLG